jgi:polyisoprenoid-binding protein YceI
MAQWVIDSDHTVAAFTIKHMMIANVHGQFNKVSGIIHFDPTNVNRSSMEVSIDVSGILTGIKKRDDHLRSPDFFESEKFTHMTFKSTKVDITSINGCKVTGELTIHGVTRTVSFDMHYFGPVKSPDEETSMGFIATARVSREDFGMTWNVPIENDGFMVGKEVQIIMNIEADLSAD